MVKLTYKIPEVMTTDEAAAVLGVSRGTVIGICHKYPGFAWRIGRAFKIPAEHVERVLRGDTPADISAQVRADVAPRAA